MLVRLPSNGVLGFKSVNAKQPTYKDLLSLVDVDIFDPILKSEFVNLFIDRDVKTLTTYDRDYLFVFGLSSICPNDLQFPYEHCGHHMSMVYDLSAYDVHTLDDGKLENSIMSGSLTMRVPLVEDEYFAYKFVSEECDEFNQTLFESVTDLKSVVTDKLDFSSVASLEKSSDSIFDAKGWFALFSWKYVCFHGLSPNLKIQCPHCGATIDLKLSFPASLCNFGTKEIMDRYRSVSRFGISYSDFLNMTVSEHLLLEQSDRE